MALCKHAIRLGSKTGLCFDKRPMFISNLSSNKICSRQMSEDEQSNAKCDYIVDTLALVWSLEARGIPYKQAEAIASTIVEVLKAEKQKELNVSFLERENEKLRNDIEKMRSEFRYEIDKVSTRQRLDWNLERCRIRDEIANKKAKVTNLTNKLDQEFHALRAQSEAAKNFLIKCCMGSLLSVSAVGLVVARILL